MSGDTVARAGMTIVLGGSALVLSYNADCFGIPGQPCEGILGTTMPRVDPLHSLLWIVVTAAFGWFVFSTVNRVEILAATLLGGIAGFSIAVGSMVLYFERQTANRDPGIANSNEGFLFILAFFALIGFIAGLSVAFVLARRRWAHRPTDPETAGTGDPELP